MISKAERVLRCKDCNILVSGAKFQNQPRFWRRVGDRKNRKVVEAKGGSDREMSTSKRMRGADAPVITKTKGLVMNSPGTLSLAQGIVHWAPPEAALEKVKSQIMENPVVHGYGPDEGMPELREKLREKLQRENGLEDYDVHVTCGAQQAFANLVLTILDPEDEAMAGGAESIRFGPYVPETYHPDLDWLETVLSSDKPPKMVVLVNPNNPTGVVMSKEELDRAASLCAKAHAWLVVDNTYEHFVYDGKSHVCPKGEHVVHIFSFSKAFGMMGWRQGYIAFHKDAPGGLGTELLKVQDTVPICANQLGQLLSLGALEAGRGWVGEKVEALEKSRSRIHKALECLGEESIAPSDGAIYKWCRLPPGCEDDDRVVEWLVKKHKVCVIPGSSCGCPGHIRVAFANLGEKDCDVAAGRLEKGLNELKEHGIQVIDDSV
eukprot:jgi/Picsp_1/6416/NSC_03764-R1_transaminase transferring nitrogenous groups